MRAASPSVAEWGLCDMLSTYMAQTVELRRMTGTDSYGTPYYAPAETVPCRFIPHCTASSGDASRTKRNGGIYYLECEVSPGDMLDGCTVSEVTAMVWLSGRAIGYKAVVK